MKLVCAPEHLPLPVSQDELRVMLYGQPGQPDQGSAGAAAKADILRARLEAAPRAWDLLSLALSVVTADLAGLRDQSPDGWTREFELQVAVADAAFWTPHAAALEAALAFLTTDRWRIRFMDGGLLPAPPREPVRPTEDCVVLLSGGLDSLIGVIDRVGENKRPLAVSQIVRGDAEKQANFARKVGVHRHLQLNHNAYAPWAEEPSQRARSFIFLAFGVLAATTLAQYHQGGTVPLYICENGFIALNPPLTGGRLGSLSTRTAHPEFLHLLQHILDLAGLRVRLENPYRAKTKGEMLKECSNQGLLRAEAATSTSCGRFQRFNYRHCGRCVPCQVRRAAFLAWGQPDTTVYVYEALGRDHPKYAGFDDIRSAAMAVAQVQSEGLDSWLSGALGTPLIGDAAPLRDVIERGLGEIAALHAAYGVR